MKGLRLSDIKSFPLATGSFGGRPLGLPAQPEPTIICENYRILGDLVRNSDAIWLSSRELCPDKNDHDLVELDLEDYPVSRFAILLARMEQRTPSPAGKEVEVAIEGLLNQTS